MRAAEKAAATATSIASKPAKSRDSKRGTWATGWDGMRACGGGRVICSATGPESAVIFDGRCLARRASELWPTVEPQAEGFVSQIKNFKMRLFVGWSRLLRLELQIAPVWLRLQMCVYFIR